MNNSMITFRENILQNILNIDLERVLNPLDKISEGGRERAYKTYSTILPQ
jgi:hypothetical protein